jgi:hypothetical protein
VAARAAIAGWADENQSGTIVYVFGGSLDIGEGLAGFPGPLHSYLLVTTRSADGSDDIADIHRAVLSCPGEHWCHRGGCPEIKVSEVESLLVPIVAAAHAAHAVGGAGDRWSEAYQRFYGDGDEADGGDQILDVLAGVLASAGWVELHRSIWEGGLHEMLLRRDRHCLTARYDPVTRQVHLDDGKADLELVLQMLADDGVLVDEQGEERIDAVEDAQQRWDAELLAAATDLLQGNLTELAQAGLPAQAAVIGLHPHGDGTLRGPDAMTLAEHQLRTLLGVHGLLTG